MLLKRFIPYIIEKITILKEKECAYQIDFQTTESNEWAFYINSIKPDMLIFDVGANAGELSLLFSHFTRKNGHVHSFEPTPSTYECLTHIAKASRNQNIIARNIALSNKIGTLRIHDYGIEYSGLNTEAKRPLKEQGFDIEPIQIIEVPCTTIDQYCIQNQIKQIDFLKIDVEGGELNVLKGASEMLNKKAIKSIVFEFGQTSIDMGNTREEYLEFFKSINYKVSNLIKGQPPMPLGKKIEMSLNLVVPN